MSAPERAMEEVRPGTGREASLGCGLAACLRRNTQLAANPQSNPLRSVNSLKPVPTDPPRHGYLPPGTRFKPIPGPLGRRRPVGSRSQAGGTRIPAGVHGFFRGSSRALKLTRALRHPARFSGFCGNVAGPVLHR
jgi:hypothetical protein